MGRVGRTDWAEALDLGRAVENLRAEMVGDWHQDPWGWPELAYLLKKEPELALAHCASSGTFRAALLDVPKENWGTRPAVVLDVRDRLVYQALVDRLSIQLIGDLSPNSYGWRLPPLSPERGKYSHNSKQWQGYRDHLALLSTLYGAALQTDLTAFFSSIPPEHVQENVQDRCGTSAVVARLIDMIDGFRNIPGRSGLVQRSTASSVLANMYLTPLDDILNHHSTEVPFWFASKVRRRSFLRWMDDMWLFVQDPARARRAQVELQHAAQALGLNLNSAKTDVYEGADVAMHALEVEHSAVDAGIAKGVAGGKPDLAPLEELVDRLVESPEKASRTSLKFVLMRMRQSREMSRAPKIIAAAPRMPHASDALFRFLKEAFTHESLQPWYLDYAKSAWATHDWSIANLGRVFPSGKPVGRPLIEFFGSAIRDANSSLPLVAVASQRLASWDRAEARGSCRDAFPRAASPQARRVLALTALSAGETRTTVRKWLRSDPENEVTLKMLEANGFGAPKVTADFLG